MQGVLAQLGTVAANSRPSLRVACASTSNSVISTSGLALLQASKPLLGVKSTGSCQHPVKPRPLRTQANSPSDLCVELIVLQPGAHPSCILPTSSPLSQEVLELLSLQRLNHTNLLPRLTQLVAYVNQASKKEARALCASPSFQAFAERSLEVVCQQGLGPAMPLLLLHLLSLLRFDEGEGPLLRDGYLNFYRHLANALEDACKRDPQGLIPQVVVGAYESWARIDLDVAPLKATSFSLRVRELIKGRRLIPEEAARMLCAMASLLRRPSGYHVASYEVNALVATVSSGAVRLSSAQLEQLCRACGAFPWPLYQAPLDLLDCVAQEVLSRVARKEMSRAAGDMLLSVAVGSAHAVRPRLGVELEARISLWRSCKGAGVGSGLGKGLGAVFAAV